MYSAIVKNIILITPRDLNYLLFTFQFLNSYLYLQCVCNLKYLLFTFQFLGSYLYLPPLYTILIFNCRMEVGTWGIVKGDLD